MNSIKFTTYSCEIVHWGAIGAQSQISNPWGRNRRGYLILKLKNWTLYIQKYIYE